MKVFKFGGASINGADAIRNVANIIQGHGDERLVVVISAMGKTTNALEDVVQAIYDKQAEIAIEKIKAIAKAHDEVVDGLFSDNTNTIRSITAGIFEQLFDIQRFNCLDDIQAEYGKLYDQIVGFGELTSTTIVHHYLLQQGLPSYWLDVRTVIKTDDTPREGQVMWEVTQKLLEQKVRPLMSDKLVITQGFLGGTVAGISTTLGREGSDYTGAILAYCLNADDLTIWKDVDGVLNADPRWFSNAKLLEKISYNEALELTYAGATVIHPKTIKPLQRKRIPLFVRSFVRPEGTGTGISKNGERDKDISSYIFKVNQMLLELSPTDLSFISEQDLADIFGLCAQHRIKVNLTQGAAKCFSLCINDDDRRIPAFLEALNKRFQVKQEGSLELITIRHFKNDTAAEVLQGKEILLSEETTEMGRYVARN